jgi:DNA polymerase III sliding clamp (beta) subunit (PCNA family)
VALEAAPGRLRLQARGVEIGEAESELSAAVEGEPQAVALNTRLLGDLLDAATSERLELRWMSPQAPVVVREAGRPEAADLWLLMPLHDQALSGRRADAESETA